MAMTRIKANLTFIPRRNYATVKPRGVLKITNTFALLQNNLIRTKMKPIIVLQSYRLMVLGSILMLPVLTLPAQQRRQQQRTASIQQSQQDDLTRYVDPF